MTDTWPDPARPGVPLNPEQDGWHWLSGTDIDGSQVFFWRPKIKQWSNSIFEFGLIYASNEYEYHGSALTPAEVDARVAEARRAALKEAVKIAEGQLQNTSLLLSNPPQSSAAWEIQKEIRALMEKKDE